MKAIIVVSLIAYCFVSLPCFGQQTNSPTQVRAWGDNSEGECNVPVGLSNVVAVAGGLNHSLALKADGTILGWGRNTSGQCDVPADLTNAVAIAAGGISSLAIRSDGTVAVWGYLQSIPLPGNLTNVIALAVPKMDLSALALKADGTVVNWGTGTPPAITNPPANLTNVVAIGAGEAGFYAIKADGSVVSWTTSFAAAPCVPSGVVNPKSGAAGYNFGLLLDSSGNVAECPDQSDVPVGLTNVVSICTGESGERLALKGDGSVVEWGDTNNAVPLDLPFAQAIATGWDHSLAVVNPALAASPPTILGTIPDRTLAAGSTAYFIVHAAGTMPLTYQWYFNGTNAISGATNSVLVLTNLQIQQSGAYKCVVSNGAGPSTNAPATLSVLPSLDIHLVPAITLNGGVGLTFRVEYLNVVGPTNAWTTLDTVTLTNSPQFYFDASAISQPARFYRIVQVQ